MAIAADVIRAGDIATFIYNGSQYILLSVDRTVATPEKLSDLINDIYTTHTMTITYSEGSTASIEVTAARLGDIFSGTRAVSSNYGIALDGTVALYVEEKNRSWCSSSNANDQRAITIECAYDPKPPYAFKPVVYETLVKLCVDICKRNGKKKLLWFGDKTKSLTYNPKPDEMVLTVHRWFANKSCPGDWLYSRMGDLAQKVTAALNESTAPTPKPTVKCPYAEPKTTIRYGSRGNGVKWVQWHLNKAAGEKLDVDGHFGVLTKAAVLSFQRKHHLAADAVVGSKTCAALKKAL